MINTHNICVYSAFFMEGFRDNAYEAVIQIIASTNGCVEMVSQIAQYAPYLGQLVKAAENNSSVATDGYPGVFEYEVCGPFGDWLAKQILEHGKFPEEASCKEWLVKNVTKFFSQFQDPASIEALTAAIANAS